MYLPEKIFAYDFFAFKNHRFVKVEKAFGVRDGIFSPSFTPPSGENFSPSSWTPYPTIAIRFEAFRNKFYDFLISFVIEYSRKICNDVIWQI